MSDLFDEKFVNRVNQVFTNHQENYNPDDWQKLRSKMNRTRKGMIVLWPHIAKAASVALFLGAAVFTANKYEVNKSISQFEKDGFNESKNENSLVLSNTDTVNQIVNNRNTYLVKEKNDDGNNRIDLNNYVNDGTFIVLSQEDTTEFNAVGNERFANVKIALNEHHQTIKEMDSLQPNSDKPVLHDYDDLAVAENKKDDNRLDMGVELSSVSNYSNEGSGNGVNLGGGLTAAYRISKKIRITTGVLIAKQSIEYAPENNYEVAYADYAEVNSTHLADNQNIENMNSADSKVSFIAIDIPLNVQFKHNRMSFSTGLSSLLYVQEKYNRTYSAVVSNSTYNAETKVYNTYNSVERVSKDETTKPFERFDFARLLNLSVGYNIPFAKGGMTVEPYLKYPLGKIGTKEVFMGSGGVALRYNF